MRKFRILVVEDDPVIRGFIVRELAFGGFDVQAEADGRIALETAQKMRPDLVILDRMIPGLDGLEVCRQLRKGSEARVLMVTARGLVSDRVEGLDAGADDYLVKPFDLEELLARVRAQLRRQELEPEPLLQMADLRLDTKEREVRRGDRVIKLSVKEWDLLVFLMRHPREVLTKERLLDAVWGYDFGGDANILEVYIRYLRLKIEEPGRPKLIHTVRGVGYVLREG